jgi:hypothetical protein
MKKYFSLRINQNQVTDTPRPSDQVSQGVVELSLVAKINAVLEIFMVFNLRQLRAIIMVGCKLAKF